MYNIPYGHLNHRKKNDSKLLLIIISSLLFYFASVLSTSNLVNIFAIIFLVYTSTQLIMYRQGGWIFLLYAFGISSALAANAIIELTGSYLIEIAEHAYVTGSAARNAFLSAFFMACTLLFYKKILKIIPHPPTLGSLEKFTHRALLILATATPLVLIACFALYGTPLLMGMSRFDYILSSAPEAYRSIYTLIPYLSLMISLAGKCNIIKQKTSNIWFLVFVVIMILSSEKFSLMFLSFFFFVLPKYVLSGEGVSKKHLLKFSIFVVAIFGAILLNYFIITGSIEIFLPRIALQGQMPYALDKISGDFKDLNVIFQSFFGFTSDEADRGIYYLMAKIAPATLVSRMLDAGITLTAPFPANFTYFFGFILAPFFVAIHAAFTGFSCAVLYKSIAQKNFFLTAVSVMIFFMTYLATTMGKIEKMFSPLMLTCLISLFLYYTLVPKLKAQKKHKHFEPLTTLNQPPSK